MVPLRFKSRCAVIQRERKREDESEAEAEEEEVEEKELGKRRTSKKTNKRNGPNGNL